jgi:paired small multidrug resistance pump
MSIELLWHDYAGLIGVALVLGAYFSLQAEWLRGDGLAFQVMNLVGALLVVVSLVYNFNLSALVIQLAWIGISLYGIARGRRRRRETRGG